MFLSKVRLCAVSVVSVMIISMNMSCGNAPTKVERCSTGALEVQIQVRSELAKQVKTKATTYDSLVIELTDEDGEELRFVQSIDPTRTTIVDTISNLSTGVDYAVRITTINEGGRVIHEDANGVRTVRINQDVVSLLQVVLVPVSGSIYLQIADIPTSVDSLILEFQAENGGVWEKRIDRSRKIYTSLDNIPHETRGMLYVAAIGENGDTLFSADAEVIIDAHTVSGVVQLDFSEASEAGGLALNGTLVLPGAGIVTASLGDVVAAVEESGELIITEIMYAANDSEYIELFNPSEGDLVFDTLIVDIDGTSRIYTDVAIGAGSYLTIGRCVLPWIDLVPASTGVMDLSGNGNWLTVSLSDGTIIDQVAFTGGRNDLEWPRVSGKRAICLNGESYSSSSNNFGRNWFTASELIDGSESQYGSPQML
jgi:hypothetical protein